MHLVELYVIVPVLAWYLGLQKHIAFNTPHLTGRELEFIADAHLRGQLAGDGEYTKLATLELSKILGVEHILLTHSCTAALEMAAILLDVGPGDEVIMPSYTFVSTANAFVMRGAVPVFVDVDAFSYNIDPASVESAITAKTKAIVAVHYAGACCDMDLLLSIANRNGLHLIEDAAQALLSSYKGKPLGTFGCLSAFSFHETKNIISGEGGALVINDSSLLSRAEIIREKGTDRSRFFRGEVDKYTWVDIGSSFLPGEIIAAFLYAQLIDSRNITENRLSNWTTYYQGLEVLESRHVLRRQFVPGFCQHNAHMFFIVLTQRDVRDALIRHLRLAGIQAVFHYVPLHSSPAGIKYGRAHGNLANTDAAFDSLLRLPMGFEVDVQRILGVITDFFS